LPPTGFHGILGLFLCSAIEPEHKYFRIGLVWGSVLPDLDLLGSALIFVLTLNTDLALAFHRSITHSLIVMMFILSFAYFVQLKWLGVRKTYFPLIIGVISGMVLHVTLDMFYFDGVTLFWPLQPIEERITIIPFTYNDLSPLYNSLSAKIIGTIDSHFELFFYFSLSYLATKYNTNQELLIKWRSRQLILKDWPKKLKLFSYYLVVQMFFFLILAIISISWLFLGRDLFIIILYIPLIPVLLLSGIIPLLMQETISHIKIKNKNK
jgi:membrane-bound metal-dependent hydrolase YbcI (DUF457 family)